MTQNVFFWAGAERLSVDVLCDAVHGLQVYTHCMRPGGLIKGSVPCLVLESLRAPGLSC